MEGFLAFTAVELKWISHVKILNVDLHSESSGTPGDKTTFHEKAACSLPLSNTDVELQSLSTGKER